MKRFIFQNIIFFLPIVFIFLFAEILLRRIPNEYLLKSTYLNSNSKNINILILGSSHSFYGLDPKYFKTNCFNAGNVSQSLEYDYAILKKYTDKMKNLKYIILPIDDFSLYSRLKNGIEAWRVKNYEIYYAIHQSNNITDKAEVLSSNINVNIGRLKSYYWLKETPELYCSKLGWGEYCNSSRAQDLVASGKIAAKRHHVLTDESLAYNVAILADLVDLAAAKKVKVILYTSPAYKTYVQYADKHQLQTTIAIIKRLSETHPNVKYYNWFIDQSFLSTDYYDADHLNERGAKKFSLKMDSVVTALNAN
ncbi:MAG: hypothetical protein ACXVJD_09615 [Mucilaginibacter sp.]